LRRAEIQWFYQEGCSWIYPDAWQDYRDAIPEAERGDFVAAYYKRLTSTDTDVRRTAARAWSIWEGSCSRLQAAGDVAARFGAGDFAEAFARIECHYFINHGFFERDDWLLENVNRIRHIPATIVQGRYDVICPMRSAWDLHCAWPEADLQISPDAGHAASEPGNTQRLIAATNRYATDAV
ncbi:MAG: prolyl aminopeptidase, partial [Sinobacteraceae bacterium]|nr:prolyl aminopeptidase [Nevskiaceae bacterium]